MANVSLQILDDILKYIEEKTKNNPVDLEELVMLYFQDIEARDKRTIADKLEADQMIDFVIPNKDGELDIAKANPKFYDVNRKYHFITFNGLLQLADGGYAGKRKKEIRLARLQAAQTWVLLVGTLIAAYGSVGLFYYEYVNHNHHYPLHLHFFQITLIITTLIVVALLLSQKVSKIK